MAKLTVGTSIGNSHTGNRQTKPDPLPVVPILRRAPVLSHPARIGEQIQVDPGTWSGVPAPQITLRWRRDGVPIPGAEGMHYVPSADDDLTQLSCLVVAKNTAGTAQAQTVGLSVRYAVPKTVGGIPELVLVQNSGVHTVNAFPTFSGSGLSFSVTGDGVTIDPQTGMLSITTEALRSGFDVTVTAANSGGEAQQAFRVNISSQPVEAGAAPVLVTPPRIEGEGRVGAQIRVDPGTWSGHPEPRITLQWLRDGVEIANETSALYTPQVKDDGASVACRVAAANAAGTRTAVTDTVGVRQTAPVARDALPDVRYDAETGMQIIEAGADFEGAALHFSVSGADAQIDPETGRVSIPTNTARPDTQVSVTARNSGGEAVSRFHVTITAVPVQPVLIAPVVVTAPSLSGEGQIGEEIRVDPGTWSGTPMPALSLQWQCGGEDVPGATQASYMPGPEEDGKSLACTVTAVSTAGFGQAVTPTVTLHHAPPRAKGELYDEIFDLGTGPQIVEAAADFEGAALRFSVEGAGAGIDPETGRVNLPTDKARVGDTVTVTAANSGGTATSAFLVTVEDEAEDRPFALDAEDCVIARSEWRPSGQQAWFTPILTFPGLADETVDAIEWTTSPEDAAPENHIEVMRKKAEATGEWQCFMRDPSRNDPEAKPRVDYSVWGATEAARKEKLRVRWRRSPEGPWSLLSAFLSVPSAAATEPVAESEWRPFIKRPKEYVGAAMVDHPALYSKGRYGGEGHQYMHGAAVSADGQTVIVAQDMGSIRKSTDFGATWFTPPNIGNPMIGGQSCAIDPADADVMFALMTASNAGTADPALNALEGMYRSTDGAQTWTLVQPIAEIPFQQRYHQRNIACWPVSGGSVKARKWRAATMAQSNREGSTIIDKGSFWSSDGGVAWARRADMSFAVFGRAYALVQHPTEEDTLYLGSDKGLWRTSKFSSGTGWTRPFAGALDGRVQSFWINPDDVRHMIASVTSDQAAKRGVFETTNGGTGWNRILSSINPATFEVGAKDNRGARMIWVHNEDGDIAQIRTLAGAWTQPVLKRHGTPPYDWDTSSLTGVTQAFFLADPTKPTHCLCHGLAYFWKTTDGVTFHEANTNFFGTGYRDVAFEQSDWRIMDLCAADTGTASTETGGDWFTESNITGPRSKADSQWGRMAKKVGPVAVAYRSGQGITRLPDPWPRGVPAPANAKVPGRKVLSLGGNVNHFIFTQNRGQDDWNDWIESEGNKGGDGKKRYFVDYDRQNPNRVYVGANVSTDGGTTWGMTANGVPVVGMSKQDGRIVYGKPYGKDVLLKSTNAGGSWTEFFSAKWPIRGFTDKAIIDVDPWDATRVYVPTANDNVLRLQGEPGRVSEATLDLRREFANIPESFRIANIKVDPNNPRTIYVLYDMAGGSNIWKGHLDADYAKADWEDITKNAPRIAQSTRMQVHSLTSDVLYFSGNGNFIYPADEGSADRAANWRALWNNMPLPIPTGWRAL